VGRRYEREAWGLVVVIKSFPLQQQGGGTDISSFLGEKAWSQKDITSEI
jgi:hypothetical protein